MRRLRRGCRSGRPISGPRFGRGGSGEPVVVPLRRLRRWRCAFGVSSFGRVRGPQIRRGDPPNLSISISGGRATNEDSPSNGERSGKSSSRQSLALRRQRIVAGRGDCTRGATAQVGLERHVGEGDSPVRGGGVRGPLPSSESRVV